MLRKVKVIDILFLMLTFYRVLYISIFKVKMGGTLSLLVELVLTFLLLFFVLIELLKSDNVLNKLIVISILFILMVVYRNDVTIILLIANMACVLVMDYKMILKDTFVGILIGVVFIVSLSIVGVLPRVSPLNGYLSFGFENPNTLGFFLLEMYLIFLFFRWKRGKTLNTVVLIMTLGFEYFVLDDITACVLLIVTFLIYILKDIFGWLLRIKLLKGLFAVLPCIIFGLTLWIAKNYLNFAWMIKLNGFLSTRPYIWNYYFYHFKFSLKGENLGLTELTDKTLDNAYYNFALIHGIIIFTFVMVCLCVGLFVIVRKGDLSLASIVLAMVLISFTETIPFRPFQSFLIPVTLYFVFQENTLLKNEFH